MPKVIGIDFGLKRTGIAITDELQIIASPLDVVNSSNLMEYLEKLILKENISKIVLGYPTRIDGSDSHITENVRMFSSVLQKKFQKIEVILQDERYTSKESSRVVYTFGNKKQQKNKGILDKISAAIILQEYLGNIRRLPNE